jgi:hypothetical protein
VIGSLSQYLRWLLPNPIFGVENLSNGENGVKLFADEVLHYRRLQLYFQDFWTPKNVSPSTKAYKIDSMKRFICAFEKLYNVKLHSMVTSTLNSFKKGAKAAVERRKQTELTIGKMKEKQQYISPEDFKVVTSLLWKRILGWISRHRSRAQDDPTISPDANLESTELQPAQLAVMAMDFMVFFYFTIGGFGARAQFLEVSCSCDLCSGFCRAVQKNKDNNDYTITLVPLQVQDLAHMGQWSDCVHSKVLEFQQLLDCTSATLCTTWGATDSQEKV